VRWASYPDGRRRSRAAATHLLRRGALGGHARPLRAAVENLCRRAAPRDLDPSSSRAVAEYLSVLDDAAFGGATPVGPKATSPTDPAARYTASANSVAGYAYSDNYLIDLKHAVIVDVEATTAIRQGGSRSSQDDARPNG
jgi:hypothetical protein